MNIIRLYSLAVLSLGFAIDASAACSRASLMDLTDKYVKAQSTGNLQLLPWAEKVYYGENDMPVSMGDAILNEVISADFSRSFYDTSLCATFTEFVAATHEHPYVIHTRMEVNDTNQVTIMESVITDEGDWVFGADAFLSQTQKEDWSKIPEENRDMRGVIKAAAEAYINNWGDPFLPVPHGTPCARLEGRIYTGSKNPEGQTCTMGAFPQPIRTENRRFVIDEEVGAVSIFHNFSWLDAGLGPYHSGTPASQQFRVENGMNRYIHEVTVCTTPGCGRGRPGG
jgi:hypothetical protein